MNKKINPPAVGGSSLIIIFAVLCLTVFALLTLSTVKANSRISDSAAESITGYYEADAKAEEILARIRLGDKPKEVTWKGNVASYTCEISQTQKLAVSVKLNGKKYEILYWKVIPSESWKSDNSLPVWKGTGKE